ncbi:MAG: hypothetical protein CL841_01960 [Crocinitomicaceae bacterium]|nr:hypothetical protein [Crocinitomicaceae bacterium]
MKKYFFITFIFVCSFSFSQSIATDRPSAQTDNSYTLYHKAFQLESGLMYSYSNGEINSSSIPNLLLRYGAFDKIEFRFSSDLLISPIGNKISISPIQLGSKIQLIGNESFQLAFLSMVTFDSVNQNTLTKLVGGNSITDNFGVGYTLGHNLSKSNTNNSFNYSVFLSNSFNSKITGFLEFYGEWNYNLLSKISTINFDFGGSYLLNDKMQLDAYFGKGLNNDLYFGSIGFSYLFIN